MATCVVVFSQAFLVARPVWLCRPAPGETVGAESPAQDRMLLRCGHGGMPWPSPVRLSVRVGALS
jgi:hypothetical protein